MPSSRNFLVQPSYIATRSRKDRLYTKQHYNCKINQNLSYVITYVDFYANFRKKTLKKLNFLNCQGVYFTMYELSFTALCSLSNK